MSVNKTYLESIQSTNECIQLFHNCGQDRILYGAVTIDDAIFRLMKLKNVWDKEIKVKGNEIYACSVTDPMDIMSTYNCWNPETVQFILAGIDKLERAEIKRILDFIPSEHQASAGLFNVFRYLRFQFFPKMTFKQFLHVWME